MPDLIDRLHREHGNMAKVLNLLDAETGHLARGERANFVLMSDILHYITNYPDRTHHPKEDLIFEQLGRRRADAAALLDALRAEHREMTEEGKQLADMIYGVAGGAMTPRDKLLEHLQHYISRGREHMRKEEEEVFPLAREALTAEDWRHIDEAIVPGDDPLFGDIVHHSYQTLYESIIARQPDLDS